MNICVIAPDYPDSERSVFTFVKQLVDELVRQGHTCYVVAPYSITRNKRLSKERIVEHIGRNSVTIFRPNYMSFSNAKLFGVSISNILHGLAVKRALKKLPRNIDCVYGHFWRSAIEGYDFAKKNNIPLVVAAGESSIPQDVDGTRFKECCEYVSGVVCVSTKNKEESIAKGLTVENRCIVLPNAINPLLFRKMDKDECRQKLGIPKDKFVIAFVGWFDERKGAKRVSDAIDSIQDGNICSIFIGSGTLEPQCKNIIYKGRLSHNEIATYLNSADVFVLPTLREGCCNAIVEAMACGLPIISSDLLFNYDVLNKDNSIMINPNNVSSIAMAIKKLYVDRTLLSNLATNALIDAQQHTIERRVRRIVEFIGSKMLKNEK